MKQKGLVSMNDEETSPEWDKIKNWLGAADTVKKHPVQEHLEREARKNPQRMSGWGVTPGKLNFGLASEGPVIDPPAPEGTIFDLSDAPHDPALAPVEPVSLPPQAPPAQPPPVSSPPQTADSVLGTNPQELRDYLMRINKPTMGQAIGSGVAGIGDAIMQGVSRAGPSHFQESADRTIQQNRENLSRIPGQVSAMGKESFGVGKELDAMNPNSPYSKINQQTYGPDLIKMGLTQEEVAQMPASLIGDLMTKKVSLEEARSRIQETGTFHRDMVGNTRAGLENTARHERTDESLRGREQGFKEDTEAQKHWLKHPIDAWKAGSRLAVGSSGAAGSFTPDVTAYAQQHGITPEQAQAIKEKRGGGQ